MDANKVMACKTHEVATGQQKIVKLGNLPIGIFNVNGEYHAMLNVCPHRGAALCEGPQCGTTQEIPVGSVLLGRLEGVCIIFR